MKQDKKHLSMKVDYDKKNKIYTLLIQGKEWRYSFHSKDKKEFNFRCDMAKSLIDYYESVV